MEYSIERLDYRKFTQKSEIDKNLNVLEGIIQGISIDGRINDKERAELTNWVDSLKPYYRIKAIREVSRYLQEALTDEIITNEEKEDLLWLCKKVRSKETDYYDFVTKEIQRLHGLLHGILADNKIGEAELQGLKKWIFEHEDLQGIYPYDEILSLLISILEDGIVTAEEEKLLKAYFSEFIDFSRSTTIDLEEIEALRQEITIAGLCAVDPTIIWENREFCFSGISSRVRRKDFADIVKSTGATFSESLRKSTNYLVVGDSGNPCWAFSAYGRKVERAKAMRKSGHSILIVHEIDFWDALDGF